MSLHYDTYKQVVSALERVVFFFTENYSALNHLPEWVWDPERTGFDFQEVKRLLDEAKAEIREAGHLFPVTARTLQVGFRLRTQAWEVLECLSIPVSLGPSL